MTESAQVSAPETPPAPTAAPQAASTAGAAAAPGRRSRGGKGRRPQQANGAARDARPAEAGLGAGAAAGPRVHPVLEQLAGLYPHLFGAVFRPLKRGIFQDLLAAHPEAFDREALKVALGIHTRSTRYLQSVAAGEKRHDLAGQPVEAMAPEHVHHALLEVYRRKKNSKTRPVPEDELLAKLRSRMMAAFEASGLTREAYTERVQGRDEAANAILEEAFAEWSARNAKDEALLRAFEASGQTLDAFADMYGLNPRTVGQQLERARRLAAARVEAAAAAAVAEAGAAEETTQQTPPQA